MQTEKGRAGDGEAPKDSTYVSAFSLKDYYKYPVENWEDYLALAKSKFHSEYPDKRALERRLEDFERLRTLGVGSFGRVMLVRDKSTDEHFAMKILDKENIIKNKQREHTLNEQRILISLKFPFCVYLEYCFKDNSFLYFVMPFVQGGEMFSVLRSLGRFSENVTRFFGAQVILALEYLHNLELVYRDLKPENLLIDSEGYLKVTDFGFCKYLKSGRTYSLCGTPEYLAPEIITSKGYGFTTDWWSVGVLLYEMAAGQPPFSSDDHSRLYEKIVHCRYTMPNSFSPELKDIINGLLQLDISRRLGCMRHGVSDIKSHIFFQNLGWLDLVNKRFKPPIRPRLRGLADSSNFDSYPEKALIISAKDKYAKEFEDF